MSPRYPGRIDWSLSALLTIQVVTLFVAIPLGTAYPATHPLLDICRMSFAAVCVAVLTRHRGVQGALVLALVLLAAGPVIGQRVLLNMGVGSAALVQHDLIEGAAFAFNAAVTALVARHVFGPGRVTAHRVQGAVLIYLNIAALFAIAFNAVLTNWPGAIVLTSGAALSPGTGQQTAALTYFSLATITTTGYGDLMPIHPLARSLANLEAVIGQLFPATLLARVVALHIEHSRERPGD